MGAVVTSDGTPVPDFTVIAKPIADNPELAYRKRFKNGLFKLEGLIKTRYEIQVTSTLYIGTKMDIDFPSGQTGTDYRIFVLHAPRNELRAPLGSSPFTVSFERLERRIPPKALAAYERGVVLHTEGRLDDALMAYGEAIRYYTGYVEPLSDAGAIYVLLNRPDSALTFLRHALRLEPNNPIVQLNIGIALMAKRQFAEAKKIFEKVVEQESEKSVPRYYLARAYYHQKKYELAESTVRAALAENPHLFEGWVMVINLALERKDMAAAQEGLRRLHENTPDSHFSKLINDQIALLRN
jgi:tetratricopeptide (TPR) repeat protein